jgi:hypothetical protein
LSEFLTNPSEEHYEAADQYLEYLYATRDLAIEYDGLKDFEALLLIASDASFADDLQDRKSS